MLERQRPLQGVRYMMYEINIVSENLRFVRLHEDDKRFQKSPPWGPASVFGTRKRAASRQKRGRRFFYYVVVLQTLYS